MTKKIVCLVLAVLLVLPVLAACSKNEDAIQNTTKEASRYTTTLNMWVITESEVIASVSDLVEVLVKERLDPTKEEKQLTADEKAKLAEKTAGLTAEQVEALKQLYGVNAAINKITKAKFKTKLNIKFLTEAQYYEKLEAAFTARAAIKGSTAVKDEERTEETQLDSYGVAELVYPDVPDYQVDILFVGNYGKYRQYADKGWLTALGAVSSNGSVQLNFDGGSKLAYYINPVLYRAAEYDGTVWGLPCNRGIGEYTYLVVDRDLLEEYGYRLDQLENTSLYDQNCRDFLNYVYERGDGTYPLYTEDGTVDLGLVHYWNFEKDELTGAYNQNPAAFSLFGAVYENTDAYGTALGYVNLLTSSEYQQRLTNKLYYETTEGFLTSDPEAKSAIKLIKGGWELKEQYQSEGYSVLTIESPRLTDDQIYNSLFCLGNWTVDEERSLEVLAYFNTNAELRNILGYGVEGMNYTLETEAIDEKEYTYVRAKEGNLYEMDLYKTGNVFIAYPDSAENVLYWEYEKMKNLDATTYPTLGLYFDTSYRLDETAVQIIGAVSAGMDAYMRANLTTPEAVTAFYAETAALSKTDGNAAMAQFILSKIGADVLYDGTHAVTVDNLKQALTTMRVSALNEADGALQSPLALYNNWREMTGQNG